MKTNTRFGFALALAALLAVVFTPQAEAVVTFTQLDDDIFVVSHRVKGIGLRGKAMKLVHEKTASLCIAAGYSHFEILEQESQSGQQYESANASIRAQFFFADGPGRIGCERNANPDYVEQAGDKLREQGYEPPEPGAAGVADPAGADGSLCGPCSIEQVAAMARAGLSDEQIRAACPGS